jgi:hypothetical protein
MECGEFKFVLFFTSIATQAFWLAAGSIPWGVLIWVNQR